MPRPPLARLALLPLLAAGCADGAPYCGLPADATGRLVVYCPDPRREPVCDLPGAHARFEETAVGLALVGGERASCSPEDEVVCPRGTEGPAYCILDPEL